MLKTSLKCALITGIFCLVLVTKMPFQTVYLGYFELGCPAGNCRLLYTVQSDRIIIDKTSADVSTNLHDTVTGNFNDIRFKAPLVMLTNSSRKYGCPDCGDQGGYLVGFRFLGTAYLFKMEQGEEPWYFRDATSIVNHRLQELEEMKKGIKP